MAQKSRVPQGFIFPTDGLSVAVVSRLRLFRALRCSSGGFLAVSLLLNKKTFFVPWPIAGYLLGVRCIERIGIRL